MDVLVKQKERKKKKEKGKKKLTYARNSRYFAKRPQPIKTMAKFYFH
jgi:hypothetical protein